MRLTRIPALVGALAALAVAPSVQAQTKVALGKPDAETTESFTTIMSIRETPSRKVLVTDPRDKVVQLVDLVSGSMVKVGREGSGPGEYSLPMALVGLPDGSTLLFDMIGRRFLTISADGKPGAILDMPRPPAATTATNGAGPVGLLAGIRSIGGYDARGRVYFEGSAFTTDGGTADSVPIMRWDRVKPTFDTVGFRRQPAGSTIRSGGPNNVQIRMGGGKRFTPTEAWGVTADGSVVRVFPEPYRVAWLTSPTQAKMGPVIPYTPMKVTEAEKKSIIGAQARNPGLVVRVGGGPGGGGGGGGGPINLPPPEFMDTKPPYDGANAVQVAPDGEVWVLRTRPFEDKIPSYDVFDRTGALVKKVSLNPKSRVVGFGKGTVYVARTDEDDLQYLQRYKRP